MSHLTARLTSNRGPRGLPYLNLTSLPVRSHASFAYSYPLNRVSSAMQAWIQLSKANSQRLDRSMRVIRSDLRNNAPYEPYLVRKAEQSRTRVSLHKCHCAMSVLCGSQFGMSCIMMMELMEHKAHHLDCNTLMSACVAATNQQCTVWHLFMRTMT
jgi:predicted ArsR family transcriptional regulator